MTVGNVIVDVEETEEVLQAVAITAESVNSYTS